MGQYSGPRTVKLEKKNGVLYITVDTMTRRMQSVDAAIHWAGKYGCTIPQEQIDACK